MTAPAARPLLSVLIPTLVRRESLFLELLGGLLPQCEAAPAPVEVVALQNTGEKSLAEYREALLRDARGTFLCFIDDDDTVPGRYAGWLTKVLLAYPDTDVVAFAQDCTGTSAPLTLFGLQYLGATWEAVETGNGLVYLRALSHVQPLRAEVAKQGSFLHPGGLGYTQEDQHFAHSVIPILLERGRQQVTISEVLYTYRYMMAGESTQDGPQPAEVIARDRDHPRPVITSGCFRWCGQ